MWAFLLEGRAYYYRIYYLFINNNLLQQICEHNNDKLNPYRNEKKQE